MSFALQKELPQNVAGSLDVEMSLLATLLFNDGRISSCEGLTAEHFVEPLFQRIFAAIEKQAALGRIVPLSIAAQFKADEAFAELGIPASQFFANLAANANVPASIPHLSRQIKDDFSLRQLASHANDLYKSATTPNGETAEGIARNAIEAISGVVDRAGLSASRLHEFSLHDAVDALTLELNDVAMNGVLPDTGVYPGSKALAEVIGTWKRGRYYVLGGRPGMGKSTVATSWLIRTALKGGNVLFFSLEMTAGEIGERVASDVALSAGKRVEYMRLSRREVKDDELQAIIAAQHKLEKLPFLINDRPGLTLAQIRSYCLKAKQHLEANGKQLDVVCIDHIGLMRASERYSGNKVAETEEISIALKAMAKDLNCAVIALAQLNRGSEQREDKRPSLSDLRWSGSIEQDADVVMFTYRPAYYLERKKCDDMSDEIERKDQLAKVKDDLEVIFAKHRGGPCPILELNCDIACSAVRDKQ